MENSSEDSEIVNLQENDEPNLEVHRRLKTLSNKRNYSKTRSDNDGLPTITNIQLRQKPTNTHHCCDEKLSDELLNNLTTEQCQHVMKWMKNTITCIDRKLSLQTARRKAIRKNRRKCEQRLVLRKRAIMNCVRAQGFSPSDIGINNDDSANDSDSSSSSESSLRIDTVLIRNLKCLESTLNLSSQPDFKQWWQKLKYDHSQALINARNPIVNESENHIIDDERKCNDRNTGSKSNFCENILLKIKFNLERIRRQLEAIGKFN